jgi:hypothetical protein
VISGFPKLAFSNSTCTATGRGRYTARLVDGDDAGKTLSVKPGNLRWRRPDAPQPAAAAAAAGGGGDEGGSGSGVGGFHEGGFRAFRALKLRQEALHLCSFCSHDATLGLAAAGAPSAGRCTLCILLPTPPPRLIG